MYYIKPKAIYACCTELERAVKEIRSQEVVVRDLLQLLSREQGLDNQVSRLRKMLETLTERIKSLQCESRKIIRIYEMTQYCERRIVDNNEETVVKYKRQRQGYNKIPRYDILTGGKK